MPILKKDNGLLHFRHFLGPDHLVQFSAWLPFAPYLSSLEILLGFSEFNLPTLFTRLESGTTDVQSFPTWKCLMLGLTLHVFFPSRLWMYCKLKSFKVRHKVQLFWKGHKNLKKSPTCFDAILLGQIKSKLNYWLVTYKLAISYKYVNQFWLNLPHPSSKK